MNDELDITQLALLGEAADCLQDVGIFVWDDDRNYVSVNQAACALLGRTREEILKLRVGELHEDGASEIFDQVQRRGVHVGTIATPFGELEFVTCSTRIAGLPHLVSLCWRKDGA